MRGFKILGATLIAVGVILILTSLGIITGLSITEDYIQERGSLIGAITLIIGVVLINSAILAERTLEERVDTENVVTADQFMRRIKATPRGQESVTVLDTSAIIPYNPDDMRRTLDDEDTYVPESVLNEIKDRELRQVIRNNSHQKLEGYEKYREEARDLISQTGKPKTYALLAPILDKAIEGRLTELSNRELAAIQDETKKLARSTGQDRYDLPRDPRAMKVVFKDMREHIERHYKISETDVDVLAMSIYNARNGKDVVLGEKDSDFEQAINILRRQEPEVGNKIHYVNNYV